MIFRGILIAFALTASVASAGDILLTDFRNSTYVQTNPPDEWLWSAGDRELTLTANNPTTY